MVGGVDGEEEEGGEVMRSRGCEGWIGASCIAEVHLLAHLMA